MDQKIEIILRRLKSSSNKQVEKTRIVEELIRESSLEKERLINEYRRNRNSVISNSDNTNIIDVIDDIFDEIDRKK